MENNLKLISKLKEQNLNMNYLGKTLGDDFKDMAFVLTGTLEQLLYITKEFIRKCIL